MAGEIYMERTHSLEDYNTKPYLEMLAKFRWGRLNAMMSTSFRPVVQTFSKAL
ncbi:uncharacterized protein PITG_11823 [Phytophthora infestans T30-4]|uniref:Uncharacterized protein n=1 Tax=Phytophthora infestans (strain T30-4) TaxID=403677 RepID=D0NHW6_PHYIT|nr:uncharacterized protein PITG_11823 [Phytophthora infestans T30-4]EEY58841.1 hypothetical protein PITG_11823 [Phytophthora infestans T30-4]|eukprot:XP_002901314.1 hypothetical protein PITG_11823 [Phytophthora infestans T30-4]